MNTEALRERIREQVRQALVRAAATATPLNSSAPVASAQPGAVVVPLRVGNAQDSAVLAQLFQRLAANPALLQMADAGLLRFDLRVDASALRATGGQGGASTSAMAATTATDPAACCSSCKAGQACECDGPDCKLPHSHDHGPAAAELSGVIGERQVKAIAAGVKTVRLKPGAVLTPLGKDALRKRGISIDKGKTP